MSSLLRSTKFVRYFTGAARTLILNSAKTTEANLLLNPKALCSANSIVLRDYATTKKNENLEPLLQKLDSEVRKFGRITKKDIDEVFDEIRTRSEISSSQSLLVIRCCGELVPEELPEQRTLLVQKIWNVLTERGVPMDVSHYNALLRVYLENEHPFSPAQFLKELETKGIQPNRVTYQRLMWRYCQEGDVDGATKVLEKMRELNFPVSEPVLNALVMGHAFHGDTDGAKAVLETMAGAGLQPSNRTYTLLASGYAKQGNVEAIVNVFETAIAKDAAFLDKDILEVIEHLATGGHGDKVELLLPYLQKGFGYNQEVYNLVLRLLNKGHEVTAKKLLSTMESSREETIFKGAFFVKHLMRINKPADDIIKTCKELKEEGLIPNSLYIAFEAALQQGKTELALKLLNELKKEGFEVRQHYYWPMLVQKGKERDEEGLLQIIREMTSEGIVPSGEALRDYIFPYLMDSENPINVIVKLQLANVPFIHSSRNVMIELLEAGYIDKAAEVALKFTPRGQYSLISRPLTNALGKTKNIDAFVDILRVISSQPTSASNEEDLANDDEKDDNIASNEIGRIVRIAVKQLKEPKLCEKLLQSLCSKGLRISTESAEGIVQILGNNMTTKLSETLSKLTSADLEPVPLNSSTRDAIPRTVPQLEMLIEQAKAKDSKANVNGLYKQLLAAYMTDNQVEKVNDLLEKLKSTNFEYSMALLAQLFEFYALNKEIDKAFEMQKELSLKNPEFFLNRYKIILMANALVEKNRFNDAVQFLKDNKPKEDMVVSFMTNSKCWQMLNFLAERKEVENVKVMTQTLIDNNYVEPSNVLLGPSIKVHLLSDDLDGGLKEFENCCKKYRTTPWKGELMKALILKEDATRLQWLADLSTQIHGEVNTLHDLVLAFVECGRLRQARRILETPGLHSRNTRLENACKRYVEEGKSEHLEGLLEATKELSHIDRTKIFYHLLVTYCKANETDKAIGLWTLLQEEGEVPSNEFLQYLGNHLKSKNMDVPFVIPDDKKAAKQKESKQGTISKQQMTAHIEKLIEEGNAPKAMDYVIEMIQKGNNARPKIIKYLLRILAEQGNVEKIQLLGKYLNEDKRREFTYDNKLTMATFNAGGGDKLFDDIYQAVKTANSDVDLKNAINRFPNSTVLQKVLGSEESTKKCEEMVSIAASKNMYLPANLLWMEYMLLGKEQDADRLWNKYLSNTDRLIFRRLLQESYIRKEPALIEKVIAKLNTNQNINTIAKGNAYSRLINAYILEENFEKANKCLEEALSLGVPIANINKSTIRRLKTGVEATGAQFKHAF